MHLFGGAENRIDRTGLDTQRTADAQRFVYHCDRTRALYAVKQIDWDNRLAEQLREPGDAFYASWRALVVIGFAIGDRLRIGPACGIAALGTLRLR